MLEKLKYIIAYMLIQNFCKILNHQMFLFYKDDMFQIFEHFLIYN